MKSILDSSFRYTSSLRTDVRKTFERIRREQRLQARQGRDEKDVGERARFAAHGASAGAMRPRDRRAGGD